MINEMTIILRRCSLLPPPLRHSNKARRKHVVHLLEFIRHNLIYRGNNNVDKLESASPRGNEETAPMTTPHGLTIKDDKKCAEPCREAFIYAQGDHPCARERENDCGVIL
ncbi:unnamed protein product [Heligmosomoides polygyrus]|uniref:Uncharacterized protein n=1 Tax=Heligmosomoides polygyrus TaxID=6339 RepID=A0A183GJC8_HELPZ|nr:unnamed protein product [Heligmosomoides polygyrus]